MRYFILHIVLFIVSYSSLCQSYDLKQAIKHYESMNLGLAEKEIEQAVNAGASSEQELSKAMNYYFLIKADLHNSYALLSENIEVLHLMGKAFTTCEKNDKRAQYMPELRKKAQAMIPIIYEIGLQQYQEGKYLEYFHTME